MAAPCPSLLPARREQPTHTGSGTLPHPEFLLLRHAGGISLLCQKNLPPPPCAKKAQKCRPAVYFMALLPGLPLKASPPPAVGGGGLCLGRHNFLTLFGQNGLPPVGGGGLSLH